MAQLAPPLTQFRIFFTPNMIRINNSVSLIWKIQIDFSGSAFGNVKWIKRCMDPELRIRIHQKKPNPDPI